MTTIKISIIGMGATGLGAAQQLSDLLDEFPYFKRRIQVHLFDPAKNSKEVGGQIKKYTDPATKQVSELGAVIIFPSWKNINGLLNRYNIETKTAPFAMQRFVKEGKKAPRLISWWDSFSFVNQLHNYNKLFSSCDYKNMFKNGYTNL